MEPINVDFSGKGKKNSKTTVVEPKGTTAKRVIISLVVTVIIAAAAYYFMLPALNFKAIELYLYIAVVIIAFIGTFGLVSKAYFRPEYMEYAKNKVKIPVILLLVLAVVIGIGYLTGAVIFRAKAYHEIIKVENGNFAEDVAEIDFSSVPRLDKDSSNMIATRALGELSDYVSQFIVSDFSTQINYKGTPVRVQSLAYGDIFKWLKNTKNGIPAYIIIDMTTQKAEAVRLENPIKYSPAEHFNEYLIRHVRFSYPTLMLDYPSFEIDDDGNPYWVVPVLDKTIGLFGGTDVAGAVLVDAVTGDMTLISTSLDGKTKLKTDKFVTDSEYQWLDQVYSASILNQQYNYYGKYVNGFINSLIGQTDVKITSDGYNYLALNDDVYMYTGVTSISSDQSIIGFVLINQRTKEAKYYQVSGALENTARTSAQGKVQQYSYTATFPLLLNVSGEPTYFMALKDASQLVKMYAMVNVKQSTVVGVGSNLTECMENYASELDKSGVSVEIDMDSMGDENNGDTENTKETVDVSGTVAEIRSVITGGETYFYIRLDESASYYKVAVGQAEKIVILNVGDSVTFTVAKDASGDIIPVDSVK
ncbi:MAG: CvpA family protein [Oscillospiraceae bacterium]|nr:CvpA family protein [Oscillospiraceae bacterium]